MLKLEEAYKIANELKEGIDEYIEYDNAFVFINSEDKKRIYIGGGHSPIVILKESKKPIPYNQYIIIGVGKEVKRGSLE